MAELLSRGEYEEMIKKIPKDICIFCDSRYQITLGFSQYWWWVACIAPYWRYHTMFVPKRHIEDITEITTQEFIDLQNFYLKVKKHLLSLNLKHNDGKPMDQFIFMIRIREENILGGSTFYKPKHLHIHFCPDREAVERFKIDETAKDVDIESIAFV